MPDQKKKKKKMNRDETDRSGGREQRRSISRQGQPVKADECKGGEGGMGKEETGGYCHIPPTDAPGKP